MFLAKEFKFDAAHFLTKYHGKCEKLHGHTYKLRVTVSGEPDEEGMIMDFAELKQMVQNKVLDKLDHSSLNDFFANPTAENICRWIGEELNKELKERGGASFVQLYEVEVWETEGSSVRIKM